MSRRLLIDHQLLQITIERLCQQLIENHGDFNESVILGIQPRGVVFANRIHAKLSQLLKKEIHVGHIDVTFFRDDF
jgi:pyrimidine operon attenuation protein/uracil phosphoribosyltransferase